MAANPSSPAFPTADILVESFRPRPTNATAGAGERPESPDRPDWDEHRNEGRDEPSQDLSRPIGDVIEEIRTDLSLPASNQHAAASPAFSASAFSVPVFSVPVFSVPAPDVPAHTALPTPRKPPAPA